MKVRVISALVLAAIACAAIYLGGYFMGALVFLFAAVGLFEFYKAFEHKEYRPVKWLGAVYLILLPAIFFTENAYPLEIVIKPLSSVNLFPLLQLLILAGLLFALVFGHKKHNVADAAITVLGGYYVVFTMSFFVLIRNLKGGAYLFILGLLGCVAADTCAFLVGVKFGKHKLIPEISPKKTVEGSLGAFAGALVFLEIYGLFLIKTGLFIDVAWYHYIILGILIGGAAQIGDLSASAIKRYTGIKDFGRIIPGHGGILDRFDAYIFVMPILYYYIKAFIY